MKLRLVKPEEPIPSPALQSLMESFRELERLQAELKEAIVQLEELIDGDPRRL